LPDIYVDADACPIKDEVLRVCGRHGLEVYMVSNGGLRPSADPRVHTVIVGNEPDAADDWIAEKIEAGDIAVTNDISLAARCIEKGARVLAPTGKPFTEESIGMAVAMRDLMTQLRDSGEITGGPSGFTKSRTGPASSRPWKRKSRRSAANADRRRLRGATVQD